MTFTSTIYVKSANFVPYVTIPPVYHLFIKAYYHFYVLSGFFEE